MKFLKSHLSLIIALMSILFSVETYTIFNTIVTTYEKKIITDYSIIVVSNKKIDKLDNKLVSKIERIDISHFVNNIRSQNLGIDSKTLEKSLPFFYKVKLLNIPTPKELESLENSLKSYKFIKRVESFKAHQNKIYNLLLMLDTVTKVFMVIILFIALLLIIKQMEVWKLEHSETMYIMDLFGAPFWLRSAKLLKLAIIDSILSVIFVYFIISYIINSEIYLNILLQLGISFNIHLVFDSFKMLGLSFGIAIFSTILVINSKKSQY